MSYAQVVAKNLPEPSSGKASPTPRGSHSDDHHEESDLDIDDDHDFGDT